MGGPCTYEGPREEQERHGGLVDINEEAKC